MRCPNCKASLRFELVAGKFEKLPPEGQLVTFRVDNETLKGNIIQDFGDWVTIQSGSRPYNVKKQDAVPVENN